MCLGSYEQCIISKLQVEVAKFYQQFRDESDAKKLLLTEYNDFKFRQLEYKGGDISALGGVEDDPVLLKLKLV